MCYRHTQLYSFKLQSYRNNLENSEKWASSPTNSEIEVLTLHKMNSNEPYTP